MNSNRSDLWNIIVLLKNVIIGFIIAIVLIVAAFVLYLTFSSKDTAIDTVGVYNLVNSENGEVIATDLTEEDIEKILVIINGKD